MSKLLLDFGFSNTKNWLKWSERLRFTTVLFVYSSGLPKDKAITGSYYVLKQIVKVPFFYSAFKRRQPREDKKRLVAIVELFPLSRRKSEVKLFFVIKSPHIFSLFRLSFFHVYCSLPSFSRWTQTWARRCRLDTRNFTVAIRNCRSVLFQAGTFGSPECSLVSLCGQHLLRKHVWLSRNILLPYKCFPVYAPRK